MALKESMLTPWGMVQETNPEFTNPLLDQQKPSWKAKASYQCLFNLGYLWFAKRNQIMIITYMCPTK